jgi:hypothetical protein
MKFPSYLAAGVLSVCLSSAPALANATGITGYSGKSSATCTTCHAGGTAPTVVIEGPTELEAGATGQYTLIIKGGTGVKGGFNVAVDNAAASLTAGAGSKKVGSELTHSAAKAFSNGEVRFEFSLAAPQSDATVKIFGVGNSVNGDNKETAGDMSALATATVTIKAAAEEDAGGCSSTGGAPVMLLSLLAGGMTLLRRRRA